MSYNKRIIWKDHVVERPRTFTETTNSDGSKTFTPAPKSVLQQGTAQSATNFNTMEEALQHVCIAYDMLAMCYQADLRDALKRIETLEAQVSALS